MIFSKPFFTIAILLVVVFSVSCKKDEVPVNDDARLVEKFLTAPTTINASLKSVIEEIKSQNDKQGFLPDFIRKNGLPIWDKTVSNVTVLTNGESRRTSGSDTTIYFVPFKSLTGSEITSYLVCTKADAKYSFTLYNKKTIEKLTSDNNERKRFLLSSLSVFSFFEKKINAKDSLLIEGIYNKYISKASLSFGNDDTTIVRSARVASYATTTTTCWTVPCVPQSEARTQTTFVCYDCSTYWVRIWSESDGSGGGTWSGGGEITSGGSGDFRILDGVLYTPYNYPAMNLGYTWLWWESQNIAVENDPNITDNDHSLIWWDESTADPNTNYIQQAKPNYWDMNNNYPRNVAGNDDMPAHDVCVLIGGQVLQQHNNGNANNACALRASRALNYSGVTIPSIPGQTWQGADGKNYFYYVEYFYNWLNKTFGQPDIHLTAADGAPNGTKFPELLMGIQNRGIYIMKPISRASFGASGHATLWGGIDCVGRHNFFTAASDVYIWKLPQ